VLLGDESPDVTATVLLESVRHKFHLNLDLYSKAFAVNGLEAMSPEMKVLRGVVAELKTIICQVWYLLHILKQRILIIYVVCQVR